MNKILSTIKNARVALNENAKKAGDSLRAFKLPALSKKEKTVSPKKTNKPQEREGEKKPFIIGGISIREQSLFARRLAFLINSGVPVLEAMHIIIDQTSSRTLKEVLTYVAKDISHGQFLHTSLKKFPSVFNGFMVNIIRVGEVSGILSNNLLYLSEELRKRDVLKKKVIGALVYPAFITVATLGVTGMLTAFIFPKIMPIFASLNVKLPLTTIILIAVSDYLRVWGLWTILGIIVFVVIVIVLRNTVPAFRELLEKIIIRIPLVGPMVRTYHVANFSRTLGIMLKSGAMVTDAIEITGDTLEFKIYHDQCDKIVDRVKRGEQIATLLKEKKILFPIMLTHMVAIGERTGKLSETLIYLGGLYEEELDDQSKNLSSAIEPILMAVMGILVGFVAVSVITPIYGITQSLSR
ncbi:MAG: type II secretion system F family protein [Patescibacteria group bacterium]